MARSTRRRAAWPPTKTVKAKRRSFDDLLIWARGLDSERVWAIEDCRHVSGALERFLLRRGEQVVRVAPKLAAGARTAARERGKSDVIDAVVIARVALREGLETLPIARLAGPELDVRLLVDHRERLVAQRTQLINDLRWQLHDLWPELEIPARALTTSHWQDRLGGRLARAEQTVRVRIARDELRRIRELTRSIDALARLAGSAPIPASSGSTTRHRLDRGGNRQLNCALHRFAVTKGRLDPATAAYLARKQAEGKTRREALRCLKRHLARRVWRLLQPTTDTDAPPPSPPPARPRRVITIHCNTPYSRFGLT